MENADFEDLNELYDSTSESGDEYVPDSSSESEESDVSSSTDVGTKRLSLDEVRCDPEAMCPPVCDTTTPDLQSLRNHISTCDINANEEPCSSQDPPDTIVVQASQKRNGKRVYDKRQYCLYCNKAYVKMARHLERAHHDKLDVAKALSLPKGSLERKQQLEYIRNRGNYAHNAAVMESGKGELVPFKRPPKDAQGNDFMHCAYCQALFTRKVLWRHMRSCKLEPASVPVKPGKNRVQSMCTFMQPVPSHIGKQMWGVISAMVPDPITNVVKNDNVIIHVGQHLLNKGGMTAKNQQCVREKMREMGRLIHTARRVTPLKTMEDFINPKNYLQVIRAVKVTCGYDSDSNKFTIPSLANKLGHTLVKVSKLQKAQGLIMNDAELVKNATEFQEVHNERWNDMISATELLVSERKACGILEENGYLFARPAAKTHFRGSDCLRAFAGACGAKCPKALTSTRLRKHAATLSTVLNMSDTEMDQLANFLGHDIRIHREFYRLPEKTLQLAKVSKLLMALEQGRLAEFHGQNLDEITIGPDGM